MQPDNTTHEMQEDVESLLHRELLWEMDALADELDDELDEELDAEVGQLDDVRALTWALLDQTASPDDLRRLSGLLLQDKQARAIYTECLDLHAELEEFCAPGHVCR